MTYLPTEILAEIFCLFVRYHSSRPRRPRHFSSLLSSSKRFSAIARPHYLYLVTLETQAQYTSFFGLEDDSEYGPRFTARRKKDYAQIRILDLSFRNGEGEDRCEAFIKIGLEGIRSRPKGSIHRFETWRMWFLKLEAVVFSGPDVEPSSDPYSHRLRVSMDFWHSAVDEIFDGTLVRPVPIPRVIIPVNQQSFSTTIFQNHLAAHARHVDIYHEDLDYLLDGLNDVELSPPAHPKPNLFCKSVTLHMRSDEHVSFEAMHKWEGYYRTSPWRRTQLKIVCDLKYASPVIAWKTNEGLAGFKEEWDSEQRPLLLPALPLHFPRVETFIERERWVAERFWRSIAMKTGHPFDSDSESDFSSVIYSEKLDDDTDDNDDDDAVEEEDFTEANSEGGSEVEDEQTSSQEIR